MPPAMPQADADAMQDRIKQLENQLKRKADPQLAVKLVELSQLKERIRQIEEANRADQNLIFETQRKYGSVTDPAGRAAIGREVGTIQMRMVRRNDQGKALREQISRLEAEVGAAQAAK